MRRALAGITATVAVLAPVPSIASAKSSYRAVEYRIAISGKGSWTADERAGDGAGGPPQTRHVDGSYGFSATFRPMWLPAEAHAANQECGYKHPGCVNETPSRTSSLTGTNAASGVHRGDPAEDPFAGPYACTAPVIADPDDRRPPLVVLRHGAGYQLVTAPAPNLRTGQIDCSQGMDDDSTSWKLIGDLDSPRSNPAVFSTAVTLPVSRVGARSFSLTATRSTSDDGSHSKDVDDCRISADDPADYSCHWTQGWTGKLTFQRICRGRASVGTHGSNTNPRAIGHCSKVSGGR